MIQYIRCALEYLQLDIDILAVLSLSTLVYNENYKPFKNVVF